MGCGHSKITIYPRRTRNKNNNKKTVTPEKNESEEEDGVENDSDQSESIEDGDLKKAIKVKPFGGPLLAQTEISSSQQDFFKMLDEKIQNGPDYNSESESERAAEAARLTALLKDWETASAGSRSLPATPKRRPMLPSGDKTIRSAELSTRQSERVYVSQIPQSVIHQSYGVTQVPYRQLNYTNSAYLPPNPTPYALQYATPIQYKAPIYSNQHSPPTNRQYTAYSQHINPPRPYTNNSPKHIPYEPNPNYSPVHKLYGTPIVAQKTTFSNGEIQQQQPQPQQPYYSQYQPYKEVREQTNAPNQNYRVSKSYQTSVTIPIVVQNQQSDVIHRKQYELT